MFYYLTIALVIVSSVFYQLFQKAIPDDVNPVASLIITYITSVVVCLLILPLYPSETNWLGSFKKINWTSYGLSLSIIGLEIGYLLAFRAGWKISVAAIFSNVAVTLILIPLGIVLYHEKLSAINIIGLILCMGGLALINYK